MATPACTPLACHCNAAQLSLKPEADAATGWFITIMNACDSCWRDVSSGIVHGAFALIDHTVFTAENHSTAPSTTARDQRNALRRKDQRSGTLSRCESSLGVNRNHCSVCTVFIFATNESASDPKLVRVAVRVLDHPRGARAEYFLEWDYGRIYFSEDGKGVWRDHPNRKALEQARVWPAGLDEVR